MIERNGENEIKWITEMSKIERRTNKIKQKERKNERNDEWKKEQKYKKEKLKERINEICKNWKNKKWWIKKEQKMKEWDL